VVHDTTDLGTIVLCVQHRGDEGKQLLFFHFGLPQLLDESYRLTFVSVERIISPGAPPGGWATASILPKLLNTPAPDQDRQISEDTA
jgi:hypothetical protein